MNVVIRTAIAVIVAALAIGAAFSYHAYENLAPRLLGGVLDRECNKPTLVEQVACLVDMNARSIVLGRYDRGTPRHPSAEEQLLAYYILAETVSHLQWITSSARYSLRAKSTQFAEIAPGMSAEKALYEGIGICGTRVEAAIAILKVLGYKTRRVQFYGKAKSLSALRIEASDTERFSHIALEVWIAGRWAYIDPTWGFFVTEDPNSFIIWSFDEIRTRKDGHVVANNLDLVDPKQFPAL